MQFEAEVRDLTSDGRGIVSTPAGQTCFVAGVWPGEYGTFRVLKSKNKIPEAALIELTKMSSSRREAPCEFHGHSTKHCGGCAWQFIAYEAQLAAKDQRVLNTLSRLQQGVNVLPIQASPNEFAYRNRAQFKTDGATIGFEAAQSNELVKIDNCVVLTEKNRQTLTDLIASLPRNDWSSRPLRRRNAKKPRWTTLDIDESTNCESVSINRRLPFRQGNTAQNSYMQSWLRCQVANFQDTQIVLELFCGSGNFTQVVAEQNIHEIFAAEIDDIAIESLRQKDLGSKVKTFCANLYQQEALSDLLTEARDAQILLLDPPRDGMKHIANVCGHLRNLEEVLYISCDLATFNRDAKIVTECGFELNEVQPVDLFPQTPHVELLASFHKK